MDRRRFLRVVGGGLTVGSAGCVEEFLGEGVDSPSGRNGERTDGTETGRRTPSELDTSSPQVEITEERFDETALAYDIALQTDLDGADYITVTASEMGSDDARTERLTSSGRHRIEELRVGTLIRFDTAEGVVRGPMEHVVGTESGVTLEGQGRLAGLDVSSVPEPSGEGINREFVWEYGSRGLYHAELTIPRALYEYCQDRPRIDRYGFYAGDAFNDVYVKRLAELFTEESGLSKSEQVDLAISFVQSLEYTSDSVTAGYDEYQRYPVETLVDRGGDCEDSAILLGAILKHMGFGVRGIMLPGHMALGIKGDTSISGAYYTAGGDRYYYIETTGEGWRVGDIPDAHRGDSARLTPLSGYPCLNFALTSFDDTRGAGPFLYTVQNSGDAVARNVRFDVEFVGANGRTVTGTRLELDSLAAEERRSEVVTVLAPVESERVKLRHSIYHAGELHTAHETDYL